MQLTFERISKLKQVWKEGTPEERASARRELEAAGVNVDLAPPRKSRAPDRLNHAASVLLNPAAESEAARLVDSELILVALDLLGRHGPTASAKALTVLRRDPSRAALVYDRLAVDLMNELSAEYFAQKRKEKQP
jgi:hypothetical protein